MIDSEDGRTAHGSSRSAPPPRVTHATSGANPAMWSASRSSSDRGMNSGK